MSSAPDTGTVRVHEALAARLRQLGVDVLFGLAGDANLFLVDSFIRQEQGQYVAATHEATAVLMGLGHAQRSGRTAVATVTHGPAMTNTITSLVEGVRNHVPLLLITGRTRSDAPEHLQAIDHQRFVEASGAAFQSCCDPRTAVDDLTAAYHRAGTERRPVVVEYPVEIAWEHVSPPETLVNGPLVELPAASRDELERAAGAIASSRRPLLVAGRGARGARSELVALAEQIGAPLATTLQAKDLFVDHPDDVGIFGTLSTPAAVEAISGSDCIAFFGCGLNVLTTDRQSLTQGRRVVAVNVDPGALARPDVDVPVAGDSAVVAAGLLSLLVEAEVGSTRYAERTSDSRGPEPDRGGGAGTVPLLEAVRFLDRVVPQDRTLVLDGGQWMYTTVQVVHAPGPDRFVSSTSFGSIGMGMGHAIGAAVAATGEVTLLLIGDGGFMLGGLTELSTAVRLGLDLVIAVCNDGGYGAEYIQYTAHDLAPDPALVDWPDLVQVATAMGATGVTVRSLDDLESAAAAIEARRGPVLIDLRIDPPSRG